MREWPAGYQLYLLDDHDADARVQRHTSKYGGQGKVLEMLTHLKHHKNCECCPCYLFNVTMSAEIVALNCQKCNQCTAVSQRSQVFGIDLEGVLLMPLLL